MSSLEVTTMPARLEAQDNKRTVNIDKPILFIGRHPECDLVIHDSRKVSRKHCCLAEINGRFFVRDLGSTNGVQINGRRVSRTRELKSGDELTIGDVLYTFRDSSLNSPNPPKVAPVPPLSDEGVPYEDNSDSKADSHEFVDHELSSDIPVMLEESDDDGFDVYQNSPRRRDLDGSDSRPELVSE